MLVDEVDIARVRNGHLVLVRLDAYSDEIFEARVARIFPSKNLQTQTFKVEATFTTQPSILYSGLAGEANIIISSKENALTVPIEYVVRGNRVVTAEGELEVVTGLRNLEVIEILAGIDTATLLFKPEFE